MKNVIKVLENEIGWSKANKKQNPNSKDWYTGFMDGLIHARNLVKKVVKENIK